MQVTSLRRAEKKTAEKNNPKKSIVAEKNRPISPEQIISQSSEISQTDTADKNILYYDECPCLLSLVDVGACFPHDLIVIIIYQGVFNMPFCNRLWRLPIMNRAKHESGHRKY